MGNYNGYLVIAEGFSGPLAHPLYRVLSLWSRKLLTGKQTKDCVCVYPTNIVFARPDYLSVTTKALASIKVASQSPKHALRKRI